MWRHAVATSGRWTAVKPCCIIQVLYFCEHDHLRWSLKRGMVPLVRLGRLKRVDDKANSLPKLMRLQKLPK